MTSTAWRTVCDVVCGRPSWVVLTQLFIGLGWLRAFAEKAIDRRWWSGGVIEDFVSAQADVTLAWYAPFLEAVVVPLAPIIAVIVIFGQLTAGLSLTSGRRLSSGLGLGMFLNLHFLAAGAVTPSAFYLLAQGALVLWLAERSATHRIARRLRLAAVTAVFLAALNVPLISTLHPAHVIDDPAVMFALGGGLAALASVLAVETCRLGRSGLARHAAHR